MSKETMYHPEWDKKQFRKDTRTLRESVLTEAGQCVCADRNSQYGEPEDNFNVIAGLWTQYLTHACGALMRPVTGYDVSMLMALFKIGRLETSVHKRDSYVDAIGYLACAAELAQREKEDGGDAE